MSKQVGMVVSALVDNGARRATKYFRPSFVITATRRRVRGSIRVGGKGTIDIVVKIGRPNYAERQFIRTAKRAGEPFPVKKIQLTFPVKRRS